MADTSTDFGWVVSIAGLMRAGVASVTPLGLSTGDFRDDSTTLFQDEYAAVLRLDSFNELSHSVSPLRGDPRGGELSFVIDLDDNSYPEISKFFLGPDAAATPLTYLADDDAVTATDVTLNVAAGTGSSFAQHDVVYIGREAFRVTSIATDAVTIVDSIPDGVGGTNTRSGSGAVGSEGHGGTFIALHNGMDSTDPSLPFNESRIWDATPFLRGREVILYKATGSGLETPHGRFIIIGEPQLDSAGMSVRVRCRDIFGMMSARQLGSRPVRYRATGIEPAARSGDDEFVTVTSASPLIDMRAAHNLAQCNDRRLWPDDDIGVYQAGDSVFVGTAQGASDAMAVPARSILVTDTGGHWRSKPPRSVGEISGANGYEMLVSDPLDGSTPSGLSMTDQTTHPYYSTTLSRVCSHPFEIVLAHLGAIASNLPDHWKCPIPSAWVDVSGIRDATAATEWARPWPGVILGYGGKSYPALRELSVMLRALGGSFAYTSTWTLTIRSIFDTPSPSDIGDARVMAGRRISTDGTLTVDTVRVRTGQGVSSRPEDAHLLTLDDGYDGEFFPYSSAPLEVNAQGLIHPEEAIAEEAVTTNTRVAGMQAIMRSIGNIFRAPPHVRTDLTVTGSARILPGEFYNFSEHGGRDRSTGLLAEPDTYLGLVLQTREDLANAGNQRLTIAKMPYASTGIGPSAAVTGWTLGTLTLDVTEVLYVKNLGADSVYTVQGTDYDRDTDTFSAGQVCSIVDANLVLKTKTFTIDSVTNTTIVTTSAVLAVGGGAYSQAAGDRVTVATFSTSTAADQARLAFVNRSRYMA